MTSLFHSALLAASAGVIMSGASFDNSLQLGENITFSWRVSRDKGELEVSAEVELDSHSWVGLGFSDYGELVGADMCVLWRDWRGATRLTDVTIDKECWILIFKNNCPWF